jgi:hypothetical protein
LFSFLIVSKNSATLDEINILVKNNLLREPRKTFYLVSTGRFLRVSHYESFEEYRDRIFSKKIVNHFIPEVTSIIQPIVKPVVVKKTVKHKKEEISQFIIVSDDEASDENSETSESEKSDSETDDDRDESDFESVVDFEEIDEFVCETIQYCDDPKDLIAIGSLLQVISKNILVAAMEDKRKWAESVTQYTLDVLEDDVNDLRRKGHVPAEKYKGIYY